MFKEQIEKLIKNKMAIFGTIVLLTCGMNSIYATTSFNVQRKSLKIYENFNINEIISSDSSDIKYSSSNENIATISDEGNIYTKKPGRFIINIEDENSKDSCEFMVGSYLGIDVSFANSKVDWKKVKDYGIDFAMIRSSYGWYDEIEDSDKEYNFQYDKMLVDNLKGASQNDIPFGIYHYSYATSVKEAEQEAEYVLNAINEYGKEYKDKLSLPIAYDVEDKVQQKLNKSEITQIIIAFCNKIREAGYTPIVYSNGSFYKSYIDIPKISEYVAGYWYANWNYGESPDLEEKIKLPNSNVVPLIWQYTQNGSIEGANNSSGKVDLDIMYMKERVEIVIKDGEKEIERIGAFKGQALDYIPQFEKLGYIYDGIYDTNNNLVDENYSFDNSLTLNAKFTKINITGLILDKDMINVTRSRESYIKVSSVLPNTATIEGEELVYTSSNENIAKVDKNGKIVPLNDGRCKITVTLKSNSNVKAVCDIVVTLDSMLGDLDNNGVVNGTDAAIVQDLYNSNTKTDEYMLIADIDNNGVINSTDAALIMDIYNSGN